MAILIGASGFGIAALIRLITGSSSPRGGASVPAALDEGASLPGSQLAPELPPDPQQPGAGRHAAHLHKGVRGGMVQFFLLASTLIFAGLAIYAYDGLSHWHRPVTLTATTRNLSILEHLTLTGVNGDPSTVRWLVESGYVRQLAVNGPDMGTAEVILPVPQSECQAMAVALGVRCSGGRKLSMSSPAAFAWSSQQQVENTGGRDVISSGLDIASSKARSNALRLSLSARTSARPSMCFSSPLDPANLVVSTGQRRFSYHFSGNEPAVTCAAGIAVLVGSPGQGLPPAFEFYGISALTLLAYAPAGTLQGFAGEVVLGPGGTTVLGAPTVVSLRARDNVPLATSFNISPGRQSLFVHSAAATSVITNGGQLVPSEWDRDAGIVVPLLGGFVSVLVFAPLAVSVQAVMDALKRWQGR